MMLAATVNFIFASIFASLAWWSLPRGWNFAKVGWKAIQDNLDKQSSNTSLYFFLAGLGWLLGGMFAATVATLLAVLTVLQFANLA